MNTDKSKVLFFQGSTRPLFYINNAVVCSADVKFLGICITDGLRWAARTQYVSQKLGKTIPMIKSVQDTIG
jgi:hypothetical protein